MTKNIDMLFCKHENSKVVCWHWTHGSSAMEIRHLEIQLKCNKCGKYYYRYIFDWNDCNDFINKHKDKEWSETCKPVLNY